MTKILTAAALIALTTVTIAADQIEGKSTETTQAAAETIPQAAAGSETTVEEAK